MRVTLGVLLLAAGCSGRTSPQQESYKYPTNPEKKDERCESLGRFVQVAEPEEQAWFKRECLCIDERVGCGHLFSDRYRRRTAPFDARNPRTHTPDERDKAAPLLAKLRKSGSDMDDWIWYSDPVVGKQVLVKYVRFYFGQQRGKDSVAPLRLEAQYEGDSWIFAQRITFKVDDTLFDLVPDRDNWKRDNGSGRVWETLDFPLSFHNPEIATALARAKAVKVRFHGDRYYSDFVVPKKQVEALAVVCEAWQATAGVDLGCSGATKVHEEAKRKNTEAKAAIAKSVLKQCGPLSDAYWRCARTPGRECMVELVELHGCCVDAGIPNQRECLDLFP
jgi:hypothetical protein